MDEGKTGAIALPDFPALSRCLIVDASFASRIELIKDLKATCLFEELVEAGSIGDASLQLRKTEFDACILGPTLNADTAVEFVKAVKPAARSQDCAFIAVLAERPQVQLPGEFIHAALYGKWSKRQFFEQLIRAILKANKNTVWPGVRLDQDGNIQVCRDGVWQILLDTESCLEDDQDLIDCLTKACADSAEDHSALQVKKILEKLLSQASNPGALEHSDDAFTRFFHGALQEWLFDSQYESRARAMKNLRAKLLSFRNPDPEGTS